MGAICNSATDNYASAGIIGLNVALVLAERGLGSRVMVIAEHLPGDTSIKYTSPWAGCNFSAISGSDANALRWDRLGYAQLTRLESLEGEKSYIKRTPSTEFWDEDVPHDKIRAMSEYLEDFRILPSGELPKGVKFAVSFTTVTLNAPKYLEYLHRRLRDQHGVHFVRQRLSDIYAAFSDNNTRIVFNCSGNEAKTLGGVEDEKCYPTRGQVVLARAPGMRRNVMRHGKDYVTYIIPRPGSNGNVILGGYLQKGNGDGSTYSYETESILDRTKKLALELSENEPEILAVVAGLRPSREGGTRIQREHVIVHGLERSLVHNYGAGGTGFQAGYGMAIDAVQSVDDILSTLKSDKLRLKL
ncbi:unnamed protein product [Clonostachys rosea]|uniref:FAD dependent oxidoreductase domain-containing protein n=1 Tax=Bionectria ochroleuca TaxID=29856 RepID=A0ABY6UEJ5_BIOOC|nr:unnamed protein product [Clonostachys rosea]